MYLVLDKTTKQRKQLLDVVKTHNPVTFYQSSPFCLLTMSSTLHTSCNHYFLLVCVPLESSLQYIFTTLPKI